jgi:AraC family transcriptional activator of tynA and feaB
LRLTDKLRWPHRRFCSEELTVQSCFDVHSSGSAALTSFPGALSGTSVDEYRRNVQSTFFQLGVRPPRVSTDQFLVSQFVSRPLGCLLATQGEISGRFPLVGYRGRQHIDPKAPDLFVLLVAQSGCVSHVQFGRSADTPAGSMLLLDSRNPYLFKRQAPGRSLYVSIPGGLLRSALTAPEDYCAIPVDLREGLSATFNDFLLSVCREADSLDQDDEEMLSTRIIDFLATVYRKHQGGRFAGTSRKQPFERAVQFIEAHLSDPDLNAQRVARAIGVSSSHLHGLARAQGKTIGQIILSMRLERCRDALTDPSSAQTQVFQIALNWGFNDAAHFSRTFRQRFGVSPRQHRAAHLEAGGIGGA